MISEKKLIELANTEEWKLIKRIMEETLEMYYDWNTDKLSESKGANMFVRDIKRKIDGAKTQQ